MIGHHRTSGHRYWLSPTGKPIGFLMQNAPRPQGAPQPPINPGPPGPFGPPPWQGGPLPPPGASISPPPSGMPFANAPAPGNSPMGLQNMLQNLTNGLSALDLPGLISNAQKWMDMFNQLGSVLKQAAPLLQLIQGLSAGLSDSDDEFLSDLNDEEKPKKQKRTKRKKRRSKGKASAKKRSPKLRVS